MNASLRGRVRRLELNSGDAGAADRAEQMRMARVKRLAMTLEQAAEAYSQRVAKAVAALTDADRPGDLVQAMRRRFARRLELES